uniref:Uncharacterized protein n=1 Tax=Yersinia enterocolitica W22703 TaxID=913028 RepID=F4N161_YEREN|nr:unknown protein [Yersinia enterocolitica W22703]
MLAKTGIIRKKSQIICMKIELNGYFDIKKPLAFAKGYLYGRGGETRTRDTRFWRPVLYQLSYAPK